METDVSGKSLTRGPELWCELHRWALTSDRKDAARWLARFAARIGCGECRGHWEELVKQRPPDTSSSEALFAWSIGAHNAVNRMLGKPQMSTDAAKAYWKDRSCREGAAERGASRGNAVARRPCAGCGKTRAVKTGGKQS